MKGEHEEAVRLHGGACWRLEEPREGTPTTARQPHCRTELRLRFTVEAHARAGGWGALGKFAEEKRAVPRR